MAPIDGTTVIVGAGFSTAAGLPSTKMLSTRFLDLEETLPTPLEVQEAISRQLLRFWQDAFGFDLGATSYPSFEDHFTLLDLAANTGHNLGHYSPVKLRALRRLSIHRVFDILDTEYRPNSLVAQFLWQLADGSGTGLISTNWDIVVEKNLADGGRSYTYGIPGEWEHGCEPPLGSFPVIKLHGSANWHYCDWCRTVDFGAYGKTALLSRTFLEGRDFVALGEGAVADRVEEMRMGGRPCHVSDCHNRSLSARVATFSYSKAFDFFMFHASWDAALALLRQSPFWTFIGYSLPEADFAFKHLLKTAEMASLGSGPKQVRVIDRDATGRVRERYERFFGSRLVEFHNDGFEDWAHGARI